MAISFIPATNDFLRSPLGITLILITTLCLFQWQTILSLLEYWWVSPTYGHGILVAPLSIFLIWRKLLQIDPIYHKSNHLGLAVLVLLNVCWLYANAVNIITFQHISVILMFTAVFLTVLGWRTTYQLLLPLLLPFIAISLWSPLEPTLQLITTKAVSIGLSILEIPTYVENYYIHIPEGQFSIETVCAGLRYLLASLAISLVYSHIYLKTAKIKVIFLAFVVVMSLMVNWIRVFGVILAGHLTNMTHILVHDHGNFGWWLFAIALIPIFWVGGLLAKKEKLQAGYSSESLPKNWEKYLNQKSYYSAIVVTGIFLIIAAFPLSGFLIKEHSKTKLIESSIRLYAPTTLASWQGPFNYEMADLNPRFKGADAELTVKYTRDNSKIFLFVAKYGFQEQGKELISWENKLFDDTVWSLVSKSIRQVMLSDSKTSEIEESLIQNQYGVKRILWHWYSVAGSNTVKPFVAQTLILKDLFAKNKMGSSKVIISLDIVDNIEHTRRILEEFITEVREVINPNYNGFT